MNILEVIKSKAEVLSPKQRILAQYIMENYKAAAFMTSMRLAQEAGVSNPTVIRFADALGYKGYPQMQQHMQLLVQFELSTFDRVSFAGFSLPEEEESRTDECLSVFNLERKNLTEYIKHIDTDMIRRASYMINECSCLFVCGFQASRCLADYTAFIMSKFKQRVLFIEEWDRQAYIQLDENKKNAAALVVYMPRYPKKTLKVIEELKKRSIRIIVITDNLFAPGCENGDILFTLPIKYYSFIDMFATPLTLLNTIIHNVAKIDKQTTDSNLKRYEQYIIENDIFVK